MSDLTEVEEAAIARFLHLGFATGFAPQPLASKEARIVEEVVGYVDERFASLTYVLGLALDFTMVAQKLSHFDPEAKLFRPALTIESLFARYPPSKPKKETRNANTLTLSFTVEGKVKRVGIRGVEEAVCDLFTAADRPDYPSAYVYNTGMWHHYQPLLLGCFKLSESGRYLLCRRLIEYGLTWFSKNTYYGREAPRVRLFEQIIQTYPRSGVRGENAGMAMQGIAFGYFKADRPHLCLIADKSRTGSARQRRFGDIDAYLGLDLELSVEVKDEVITERSVEHELGQFAGDVRRHRARGVAFVFGIDDKAREWLAGFGVAALELQTVLKHVELWDWPKQEAAVQGMLHFVAHVEQRPEAVARLLTFIRAHDPAHGSLAYFRPASDSPKG